MHAVFVKPLIEVALGFGTSFDPYKRYKLMDNTVTKVSDYLYEVNPGMIDTFIEDILDVIEVAKCVPVYIDTEENCIDYINQVMSTLKTVEPTDLLWISPDTYTMEDKKYFSRSGNYYSGTAILRNGRTFLVAKKVRDKFDSGLASDYRVFSQIINSMTKEDLCTDKKVRNIAGAITKIIKYATEVTIEEMFYHKFGNDLFRTEESVGIRVGSTVDIYHNCDKVTDKLVSIIFEDRNIFEHCEILARFEGKFTYGVWQEDEEHEYDLTTPTKAVNMLKQISGEILTLRKVG